MTTSLTRSCQPLLGALHFHSTPPTPPNTAITHPTRDSDGYPLEDFDEVDSNLVET